MADTLGIDVRGVCKQFRQGGVSIDALKNVSLQVANGEIVMIVGPSGCGKTTLLSVIAGTLFFDQGEIDLFGHSIHRMSTSEMTTFRRQHIGFTFQQYHLIPTLSCLENVTIPLLLNGVSPLEAERRAAAALGQVGLKGREKDKEEGRENEPMSCFRTSSCLPVVTNSNLSGLSILYFVHIF